MEETLYQQAIQALQQNDPRLAPLIEGLGDCNRPHGGEPFQVLCGSIIAQQLATRVAEVLEGRFLDFCGGQPTPRKVLAASREDLRSLGLSGQKIAYLQDLARCAKGGQLPLDKLAEMEDQAVVKALIQVKGIGVWTAQMFLIFGLGRPDVWAVDDLGLRKGVQALLGLAELPAKETMTTVGEDWRPHRTTASFVLWKSLSKG